MTLMKISTLAAVLVLAATSVWGQSEHTTDYQLTPTGDASSTTVKATSTTTPRTLAVRASDTYSVKDFGAVGDGVTDDSAAFQAAFTSAPFVATGGSSLYVPPGTYIVHGVVLPNNQPVNITCAGEEGQTTLKLPNGANTYIFANYGYVNNTTAGEPPLKLYHCQFSGNNTNQTVSAPLLAIRSHNSDIGFDRFTRSFGDAIYLTAYGVNGTTCSSVALNGNHFHDNHFDHNNGSAIRSNDCNVALTDGLVGPNNIFGANAIACPDYQLNLATMGGWMILGNKMFGSTGCGNLTARGIGGVAITGNQFDGSYSTSVGATPIIDVNLVLGSADAGGGLTMVSNDFKNNAASLPGSSTSFQFVTVDDCCVNGSISISANQFNSEFVSVAVPIGYTGFYSTRTPLIACANAYSSTVALPSNPEIFTCPTPVTPILVGQTSSAPTGTASLTMVHMGLAFAFTPAKSGNVLLDIEGDSNNSTAGQTCIWQLTYGTGTPPVNGVAQTGTLLGSQRASNLPGSSTQAPMSLSFPVSGLSLGTLYWADLVGMTGGAGTCSMTRMSAWVEEH